MTTQPENTEPPTTDTAKDDRKKKALAFAKNLGQLFSTNAAVGAGFGVGLTAGVLVVTRLITPKIVKVDIEQTAVLADEDK
jgi:hypothetical protein